jgi:peroxiredoxin Q/BCP
MLETGSQAPDFSVTDHQGRTHTLADYRGRHLVLWFYPMADTPG